MRINSLGNLATYQRPLTKSQADGNFEKSMARTSGVKNKEIENKSTDDIYEDLSNKYNIRKSTFEDLVDIADSLYSAGEISLKEVAVITFDYERATENIKRKLNNGDSTSFSMYETKVNEMGQRDWIAEFEARASKDFKYGNLIGYSVKMKILNIFHKLDS